MAATEHILQPRYFAETALYLRSASTMSPLHDASTCGHTEVVRLLLDEGAPMDEKDENGMTALMLASRYGRTEVVRLLLDKGAAVDVKDNDGITTVVQALATFDEDQLGRMVATLVQGQLLKAKGQDGYALDATARAVLQLVRLAGFVRERALKLRSSDPHSADDHQALFVRLQLAAAACVQNDESDEARDKEEDVQKLFLSNEALEHAVQIKAKELLAQPVVQKHIMVIWRGQFDFSTAGWLWGPVIVVSLLIVQLQLLIFLPLVALVPSLEPWLNKKLSDGAGGSLYLLGLPIVKFGLECAADWRSPSRSRSSRPPTSPLRPSRRCCSSGWEAGSCGRPTKSWRRLAATQSRGLQVCTTVSLPTGATASTASTPRRSLSRLQRSSRSCQPATARTRQPHLCARWPSSCSGFASSACCSYR